MRKVVLLDWGNTVMVDFELEGPMYTWEKVAWEPGADQAVPALSQTCDLYLATNAGASDTSGVVKALERIGAQHYFKHIFLAAEVGFAKPDLRFFQFIIHKINGDPSRFIMVGDHYEKDIVGAKYAGIKTIFYNRKGVPGAFDKADRIVSNLAELPLMIETL